MAEETRKVIIVQKGSSKNPVKVDTELLLSALRKLLNSKDLMSEEDLFVFGEGAEILKSDEGDFVVKDLIGTGNSLTIKSTAQRSPEPRTITVEKGSSKTPLKLDDRLSLPEMRKLLITKNLMSEEDLFVNAGGAEIRKSDEPNFLVKDVIGAGTSVTLKRPPKTITVQKRGINTPHQVNLDQKLSELRNILTQANVMSDDDSFQTATGVIPKKIEDNVSVKDAINNDTLTIISNIWG